MGELLGVCGALVVGGLVGQVIARAILALIDLVTGGAEERSEIRLHNRKGD